MHVLSLAKATSYCMISVPRSLRSSGQRTPRSGALPAQAALRNCLLEIPAWMCLPGIYLHTSQLGSLSLPLIVSFYSIFLRNDAVFRVDCSRTLDSALLVKVNHEVQPRRLPHCRLLLAYHGTPLGLSSRMSQREPSSSEQTPSLLWVPNLPAVVSNLHGTCSPLQNCLVVGGTYRPWALRG